MSDDEPKTVFVFLKESTAQSVVTDVVTFGCLVASTAANHFWLGDSSILQFTFAVCFFAFVYKFADKRQKRLTRQEAIEWLQSEAPQ